MILFEETVALVTGAAMRVGREIALTLARAGCDIVAHYRDSANEADELADEIRGMGRQVWLVQGDFAEPGAAENVMREAWNEAAWIDILVNNAACYKNENDPERIMRINA
ncbi:MAG: SDR family NAD(P)-dependent oxidoreductase, partial [Kiritimatiellaeota bacterium]|nr:SDR family NAD(P)-dependent oxidoreductase [Kiritimatiellota bacterium]